MLPIHKQHAIALVVLETGKAEKHVFRNVMPCLHALISLPEHPLTFIMAGICGGARKTIGTLTDMT